jgi:flagellar L-ring protein precursor FlgH
MSPQHCLGLCLIAAALSPATTSAAQQPDSIPVSRMARAGWLSDSRPLRPGDILTVLIDEQSTASERTTVSAVSDRGQKAGFGTDGTLTGSQFGAGLNQSSNERGNVERGGGLLASMSVRVTSVDAAGNLHIEGNRRVIVDKRPQELRVAGIVRAQDVSSANVVHSSRIADAEISYSGKKLSPKTGILGKIIGIIWP